MSKLWQLVIKECYKEMDKRYVYYLIIDNDDLFIFS